MEHIRDKVVHSGNVLHCLALFYIVLNCFALFYIVLHCFALLYSVLHSGNVLHGAGRHGAATSVCINQG